MTRITLQKPLLNLTIYCGPPTSGKTTALKQAFNQAKNNGHDAVFIVGRQTEVWLEDVLQENPNTKHVFWDDGADDFKEIATRLAKSFPQTHFHVSSY